MHRLIIGPGSLVRFYQIFSLAFLAYSVVWTMCWMALRGAVGGVMGALGCMAVMGWILACGFAAPRATLRIIAVLFATNVVGYFVGEWVHNGVLALREGNPLGIVLAAAVRSTLSKAVWGLFYGIGFGAGIGWAVYVCQDEARRLIKLPDATFVKTG